MIIYNIYYKKIIYLQYIIMLDKLSFYTGMVPFQLYTIPGLLTAILQFFISKNDTNVRVHILPQLIAFSLIMLIKSSMKNINKLYAPSGKACVVWALAITLFYELKYNNDSKLFTFKVKNNMKQIISYFSLYVALMVSYFVYENNSQNLYKVLLGSIIGIFIGAVTWNNMYNTIDDKNNVEDQDLLLNKTNINIIKIVLVISVILLISFHMLTIIKGISIYKK